MARTPVNPHAEAKARALAEAQKSTPAEVSAAAKARLVTEREASQRKLAQAEVDAKATQKQAEADAQEKRRTVDLDTAETVVLTAGDDLDTAETVVLTADDDLGADLTIEAIAATPAETEEELEKKADQIGFEQLTPEEKDRLTQFRAEKALDAEVTEVAVVSTAEAKLGQDEQKVWVVFGPKGEDLYRGTDREEAARIAKAHGIKVSFDPIPVEPLPTDPRSALASKEIKPGLDLDPNATKAYL